jgi:hypothetical protein
MVVRRRDYQDLIQHLVCHTLSHPDENATGVYAATEPTLEYKYIGDSSVSRPASG